MIGPLRGVSVWAYDKPCDIRRTFNTLQAILEAEMQGELSTGDLFEQKAKCKCGSCIKTARGPRKLFDGARYSVGFAVHVAMEKCADHLPLERQVKGMKRDGLLVDSQTLWDQLNALVALLKTAYERQHRYLLEQPVIGADETFWRLMGEKGKKKGGKGKSWQVWATVCSNAVHYAIKDSRSAEAAKAVLKHFDGVLMADDYAAYSAVQRECGFVLLPVTSVDG